MTFIPYLVAVLILFLILKILALPMKIIIKFIINAVVRRTCNIWTKFTWSRTYLNLANSCNSGIFRNTRSNNCSNYAIFIIEQIKDLDNHKPSKTSIELTNLF